MTSSQSSLGVNPCCKIQVQHFFYYLFLRYLLFLYGTLISFIVPFVLRFFAVSSSLAPF